MSMGQIKALYGPFILIDLQIYFSSLARNRRSNLTMAYYDTQRRHGSKKAIFMTLVLLMTVLLSACNGDPQAQQNANLQKIHLDRSLAHARSIGVPSTLLQPIVKQERQISSTNAPFTLLS